MSGDFILEDIDNTGKIFRMLVEIKNYKRPIPKIEIDKFYRDLRANTSIDAGIAISYNTKFVGFKNDRTSK